jgi:hypothetical protein
MAIPSRQIGWGTEENLLWQISKQLEYLTRVVYNINGNTTTTTTSSTSSTTSTTTSTTTTTFPGYYTYSLGSTSTETANCLTGPVSPSNYYSADSVLTIGTQLYTDTSLTIEVELGQTYFNTTGKYSYGATGIDGIFGFQSVSYIGGGLVSDVSQGDACTGSSVFNAFVACGTAFDNGTILYTSPTLATPFTSNTYFSYGGFSYTVGAVNPGELSNKTAC